MIFVCVVLFCMSSFRCVRALTLALQATLLAEDHPLCLEIVEHLYLRLHPLFGLPERLAVLLEALLSVQLALQRVPRAEWTPTTHWLAPRFKYEQLFID